MTEKTHVIDADRIAAAPIMKHFYINGMDPIQDKAMIERFMASVMSGDQDEHFVLQAFANHRIEREARALETNSERAARATQDLFDSKNIAPTVWFYQLGEMTAASRTRLPVRSSSEVETPLYASGTLASIMEMMVAAMGNLLVLGERLDQSNQFSSSQAAAMVRKIISSFTTSTSFTNNDCR